MHQKLLLLATRLTLTLALALAAVLGMSQAAGAVEGVRNLKPVLTDAFYRGGGPGGRVDLSRSALESLCREGFTSAVYLYSTNFKGTQSVDCTMTNGRFNRIVYEYVPYRDGRRQILEKAYQHVMNPGLGRMFVHCWNGRHAAGEIAAIALKQFCGYSSSQAVDYWLAHAGSDGRKYSKIIKQEIPNFQPYSDLQISRSVQSRVCN